jgi:hypothetical protein
VTCVKILTLMLELAAKFDLVKDKMSTQMEMKCWNTLATPLTCTIFSDSLSLYYVSLSFIPLFVLVL